MQPRYITLSSSGSSPWQVVNWHGMPQQYGFTAIGNPLSSNSSFSVDCTLEDPTKTYPSPISSGPIVAFSPISGSASSVLTVGLTSIAIAAFRLTVNALSSAGASVTLASVQAGIGG